MRINWFSTNFFFLSPNHISTPCNLISQNLVLFFCWYNCPIHFCLFICFFISIYLFIYLYYRLVLLFFHGYSHVHFFFYISINSVSPPLFIFLFSVSLFQHKNALVLSLSVYMIMIKILTSDLDFYPQNKQKTSYKAHASRQNCVRWLRKSAAFKVTPTATQSST